MFRGAAAVSWTIAIVLGTMVAVSGQAPTWTPPDAAGQGQSPIMPVHQEPHHRQVFQHGPMRIIDLQIPPGDASWFHLHEWPVFYVTVADSQTRTQLLGQEWGARAARAGGAGAPGGGAPPARAGAPPAAPPAPAAGAPPPAGAPGAARGAGGFRGRPRLMSDVSYAERAVTHRIENIGTSHYRAIGVINETRGSDEPAAEPGAGFSGKPEITNRWFRAYRVTLAAGEKSQAHQHTAPVVFVQDTAGKATAAGAMTFELNEPGQWAFFDAGDRHEISNVGDTTASFIEVELRRP